MPIIPDIKIIQAMIIKAYGKTSLLNDAIDAVLTLLTIKGSWMLNAVCFIWPDTSNVMLSIAGLSKIAL